jgi:hypothetical protein
MLPTKKIIKCCSNKKKQKAFNELRTTSHYPSKIKLFPKTPRTYRNTLPIIDEIKEPILNDIGKSLVGFTPLKI